MDVAKMLRIAFAVLAVSLVHPTVTSGTDDTTFRDESAETTSRYRGKREDVYRLLTGSRSEEDKVRALREVIRLGMTRGEIEQLLGTWAAFEVDKYGITYWYVERGAATIAVDFDDDNKAASITYYVGHDTRLTVSRYNR
jgi:hypothetical protein